VSIWFWPVGALFAGLSLGLIFRYILNHKSPRGSIATASNSQTPDTPPHNELVLKPPLSFSKRHPQITGALWGASIVLFASALFFVLNRTAEVDKKPTQISGSDSRCESLLMLSSIAISMEKSDDVINAWGFYMQQPIPRKRPPQLKPAIDWLEKTLAEEKINFEVPSE